MQGMYDAVEEAREPRGVRGMADQRSTLKVNVKAFVNDFVRGVSERELREKYSLEQSQLRRVVGVLKKRGTLTPAEIERRKENLKVRFGRTDGPPDPEMSGKPPVDLDTGLVLHCPSCGAAVKRGAQTCEYCNSHLDFSLEGKTIHCPHCLIRIPAGSRFCVRCAKPVKGAVQEGELPEERLCPRCEVQMVGGKIGDFPVMECNSCAGMFVPHETFEMIQDHSQRVIESGRRHRQPQAVIEETISYVRCPVCLNMMNRKNFAGVSGVILDVCGDHGIWFDPGEMDKIMDFIAKGGLQKARAKDAEREKYYRDLARLRRNEAPGKGTVGVTLMSDSNQAWSSAGLVGFLDEVFTRLKE